MSEAPRPIEVLFELLRAGDESARKELFARLYFELKSIAKRQLAKIGGNHTLQPTDLLHEAWMKIGSGTADNFQSELHFCCVAAKAMRSVLVDHARQRGADKRGRGQRALSLDETGALSHCDMPSSNTVEILPLHEALEKLAAEDGELSELVELRYFAGLTNEEIASLRGLSLATIERRFAIARAWLHRCLKQDDSNHES
jgi:RNA polymerase sigma-70 factor, ECF subfamily